MIYKLFIIFFAICGVLNLPLNSSQALEMQALGNENPEKGKTCQCVLNEAAALGVPIFMFKDVCDFPANGEAAVAGFIAAKKEGKNFANCNVIYISLIDLQVEQEVILRCLVKLKTEGIIVVLNVSGNKFITDDFLKKLTDLGLFSNIYSLNLSNTNISDFGVSMLHNYISNNAKYNSIALKELDIEKLNVGAENKKLIADGLKNLGNKDTAGPSVALPTTALVSTAPPVLQAAPPALETAAPVSPLVISPISDG
jgi:hypothetical protein